ncbi:hypothetical protein MMC34_004277 [Xylographa carneopallida]|nr:hypothetical protein [Xylographa carneopallida]
MRLSQAVTLLSILLGIGNAAPAVYTSEYIALGCPKSTTPIATVTQQYEALNNFATLLYLQKSPAKAFDTYVATHLINHAADVPGDGAATALQTVGPLVAASAFVIEQLFIAQDRGVTYFKATTPVGTVAAIDMFRMSGTCLIEHWVVQNPVLNSTNPHPYF